MKIGRIFLYLATLALLATCGDHSGSKPDANKSPDAAPTPDASTTCKWDQGIWDQCQFGP